MSDNKKKLDDEQLQDINGGAARRAINPLEKKDDCAVKNEQTETQAIYGRR